MQQRYYAIKFEDGSLLESNYRGPYLRKDYKRMKARLVNEICKCSVYGNLDKLDKFRKAKVVEIRVVLGKKATPLTTLDQVDA